MKLYTEEQVKAMIEKSQYTGFTADFLIHMSPSVQLPTDEQLVDIYDELYFGHDTDWIIGAIWMRDKIQGGEQ